MRWTALLAALLWLAAVALIGASFASLVLPGSELLPGRPNLFDFVSVLLVMLTFPTVGAVIAWQRPRNPIGWLFFVVGLGIIVGIATSEYTGRALHTGVDFPAADWAAWSGNWSWILGAGTALTLVLLLFPTGRPPTRRWRLVLWVAALVLLLAVAAEALVPGALPGHEHPPVLLNPVQPPRFLVPVVTFMRQVSLPLLLLVGGVSAVSLVIRFRRSRGVERQQLKWFVYPTCLAVASLAVAALVQLDFAWYLALLGLAGMPIAAGIAMLRHRLYDIDLLINRTLVYAAVTVTLGTVYVGSVIALQGLLSGFGGGSSLAVAASTLAVAALFQPIRRRLQRAVDRRFYRSRYDAQRTLERFSGRLRDEVDLARLTDELTAAVEETLQPAALSVWMRR